MMSGLSSKTVLITGASGDIGSEMARQFASEGAKIGLHYHSDRKRAEAVLNDLRAIGVEGDCFQGDLLKTSSCRSLIQEFLRRFKKIDVLINNAGAVVGPGHFLQLNDTAWDRTFALNTRAPFFLAQHAFASMQKAGGGRIINISSVSARYGGSPITLHYGAAKAALEAMTIGLARAGAPHEILVNTIQAGFIDTRFHNQLNGKDIRKRIAMIPLKRAGHPADVASMAVYLAGETGRFITGQTLRVTGGD